LNRLDLEPNQALEKATKQIPSFFSLGKCLLLTLKPVSVIIVIMVGQKY